ncbi:type IV pilin protein [Rheinheimera sp.]|uniref:type IV pilin protein n=1 Tax=Rheinheimera sp. TaxID=1869214 RepID=UPI003AF4A0ED
MARSGTIKRPVSGFSLIELLVAVTIVGILAGIAYPSYTDYVLRGGRAAVTACLLEQAQFMEQVYSANLTYASNNGEDTALPDLQCSRDLAGKFSFELTNLDSRTFTLNAAAEGHQASDSCTSFSYNQAGIKTANGSGSAEAVNACW